jgi:hypothetical protein
MERHLCDPFPPLRRRAFGLCVACLAALLTGCTDGGGTSHFDWSVTPDRRTIQPGGQTTFTIEIKSKVNINSQVALRVEGTPTGATASFDTPNLPDTATTATLTVQTPATLEAGTYTLKIFAKETGQTEAEKDVLLIVETSAGEPDFTLEVDPAEYTFANIEAGKTFTYYARPLNNFQGTVTVSVSGLSDDLGLSQAVTPAQVTIGPTGGAGGTFVLRGQPNPPVPSPVDLTVTATSGSLTHTRTIRITIPQ